MKKSDIYPGYLVEIRNGNKYFVVKTDDEEMYLSRSMGWIPFENYDDDLTNLNFSDFDIVVVYGYPLICNTLESLYNDNNYKWIWKRDDSDTITEMLSTPINTPLNDLAKEIHENAKVHGWYDDKRSFGEIVALCHSELSEALEEYRSGKPMAYYYPETPCKCNLNAYATDLDKWHGEKLEGIATEMIDCLIRILDWCGSEGIDVDKLVRLKHEYNKSRPYKHGGKVI